ncbi:MAG: hypothetical protein FLDDKLPJ_01541 [Phycisphaerae bacterium]|nr:hypothetical protein [Phycisphaerae bacterium]
MVVKTVNSAGELEDRFFAVRYGATPQDWEEAADETHFVELIDGRLIMHSLAGLGHQRTFGFLHHLLRSFVEARKLGEILTGPFTMDLALERKFEPDLIFITRKTMANLAEDRLLGPADLAIEIASASTRAYDRGEKRECYRVGRVAEYVMIDAFSKLVTLDRPAGREILSLQEGWIASESCKGFAFRAEWLWADPLPEVADCLREIEKRG